MGGPVCRIIQISDTHLLKDKEGELLGVKTTNSFQAVVDLLETKKNKIDIIIHSGDVSQDQSPESYRRAADMLKRLNLPIYSIPGNHDDELIMAQVYPRHHFKIGKQILIKNWQLILLNSRKPGAVEGFLSAAELNFLEACLQENPEHYAMIIFHHHPFSVGTKWLDPLGLKNAEDFWQLLAKYPKAKYVLFGHVHQEFECVYQQVQCYAVPSTSVQFKPCTVQFALDNIPPGYRWLNLYDDGHLETGIERAAEYIGTFQREAKGY